MKWFKKREQNIILDTIYAQLPYEPNVQTRNRFRRRDNEIAEWELRVAQFRVYYNVEETARIVSIEAVG